jgi:hypothetical protein
MWLTTKKEVSPMPIYEIRYKKRELGEGKRIVE